jgi:hypothetical protein
MNSKLMKVTLLVAILAVALLVIFPLGLGRTLIWGYNGQGSMMGQRQGMMGGQGQNQQGGGMMGQRQGMMGQGQNQGGGMMGQHQGMMGGQGQNQGGGMMGQHQGMMGQGQNQGGGMMGQRQGMMGGQGQNQGGMMMAQGRGQNQSGMMGQGRSFFSPIFLIGGLVRLALLVGLAGLGFIFLRGVWSGFYQPTR